MSGARLANGLVRRPVGPHSHYVHQLLRLLEESGLAIAPRLIGVEGGEEVLSYLDGHVPVEADPDTVHPIVFSDNGMQSAFRLIRSFHDAVAGSALAGAEEVVCHGDLSPWNTVYNAEGAIAFIDWDAAAPGSRTHDLGYAAWRLLMLGFPAAPPLEQQRRLLSIAADAYGIWEPPDLLDHVVEAQERQRAHFEDMRTVGDPRYLRLIGMGALGYITEAQEWLASNRDRLY